MTLTLHLSEPILHAIMGERLPDRILTANYPINQSPVSTAGLNSGNRFKWEALAMDLAPINSLTTEQDPGQTVAMILYTFRTHM